MYVVPQSRHRLANVTVCQPLVVSFVNVAVANCCPSRPERPLCTPVFSGPL